MSVQEVIPKQKTELKIQVKEPSMYKVLLHNDDFTPMDFVVQVLETIFEKSHADAFRIMMDVHQKNVGICGIYILDIAQTKVEEVHALAEEQRHPLKCSYEKL